MSDYLAECDICDTAQTVHAYSDWKCEHCGQTYVYNEGHHIELSDRQWNVLERDYAERLREQGKQD